MKMRFSSFFLCLVFLSLAASLYAEEQQGYVTALNLPAGFTLGRLQVITSKHTEIYGVLDDSSRSVSFTFDVIPPGTRLIVKGKGDPKSHAFLAKTIDLLPDKSQLRFSDTGQEDKAPTLTQEAKGWRGTVYVDGYVITVNPETSVTFPANAADALAFHPNWRVHYEAARQKDASILASKISFALDENEADLQKYRAENDFKIDPPDYDKGTRGTVHFFLHSLHIIPNKALNEKITAIGESLIPEWQKQLDDNDPAKIHFRFYVLEPTRSFSSVVYNDTGTILVPLNVLMKLNSDAQLASLLAAGTAASMEGVGYYSRSHKHTQQAIDIGMGAIPFGAGFAGQLINDQVYSDSYWKPLAERIYRVGMQYMVAAGYDPHQASVAQQRIAEKHPDGKEHPNWISEYIDAELGFHYSNAELAKLRIGETEYAALLELAKAPDTKAAADGKNRLSDQ